MPALVGFMARWSMASTSLRAASCVSRSTREWIRADISFAGPGQERGRAGAGGRLGHPGQCRVAHASSSCWRDHRQRLGRPRARGGARQSRLRAEVVGHEDGRRAQAVRHRRRASARACLREIGSRGLDFEGFHIFSGSQNLRADADLRSAEQGAASWRCSWPRTRRARCAVLNLGGGFGIPYFPGEQPLDRRTHRRAICAASLPRRQGAAAASASW